MNVLLIEDEPETLEALASYLRLHGLTVHEADTLRRSDELLQAKAVDVIVLDIELPDGSGLAWLKENAAARDAAGLVIVSAHHQEATRLKGLELGADVFLRKPLSARELYLQLENIRSRRNTTPEPEQSDPEWVLIPWQWQITSPEGHRITLTLSDIRLLKTLAHWSGEPVPRLKIIKGLEADPAYYDERRLETLVRRLRQKVRDGTGGQPLPLITVRGVGYAFRANLRVVND